MTVEIQKSVDPAATSSARRSMAHLLWFFALVYVAEGSGALISQPLNYYLKQVHGWTPLQISAYVTILNIPWMTKPLYGLVSDLIPLFGYRRKSYLLLANATAIVGLLLATLLTVPDQLVFALLLTAFATAISSAVTGAVLVENGQQLHESGTFVNQQWLWYTISAMTVAILGGQLVERFEPATALHSAAAIGACAPLLVIFGTVFLVPEKKACMNIQGMKYTLEELLDAFRGPRLWIIAAFIFLYYFSPGLGTPLYFVMTDNLKFSQAYIGSLAVLAGCGWILGAFLYRRYFRSHSLPTILRVVLKASLSRSSRRLLILRPCFPIISDHISLRMFSMTSSRHWSFCPLGSPHLRSCSCRYCSLAISAKVSRQRLLLLECEDGWRGSKRSR
jgi:MFS family permease